MTSIATSRCRLTAVIVVEDASADLRASMFSVAPAADETIVLNVSGHPLKASVPPGVTSLERDPDDPAAAKNDALAAAQGDWILFLNAGESLAAEAAQSMCAWLCTQPTLDAAYWCWLDLPPATPDLHGEQVAVMRLFPKCGGLRFSGIVRETALPAIEALQVRVELSDWRIAAPSTGQDAAAVETSARQLMRLATMDVQQVGMNPRALVASAEAHATLGDRTRATQHYYQALRLADRGSLDMLIAYYGLLGLFRGDESDRRQQLAVCLEALETFPYDAQLLCAMGAYLQQQDHLELACRSFQAAFEIGQVEPRAIHLRDLPAIGAVNWSLLLQIRGEHERALRVLDQACQRFPQVSSLARRKLELLVQLGRDSEALAATSNVAQDGSGVEAMRIGVRGACLAAQGNWIPALGYLRTAYEAGCHDPICLRWLTIGLLALGQADAARPVLQDWRAAAPSDVEAARYQEELDKSVASPAIRGRQKARSVRVDSAQPAPEALIKLPGAPAGATAAQPGV
ncbi:MAG: hypothetical protein SGJ19_04505 [Planctomycetia bacterium]|nr:hypothetical protein [Planctomycetia bacterium]